MECLICSSDVPEGSFSCPFCGEPVMRVPEQHRQASQQAAGQAPGGAGAQAPSGSFHGGKDGLQDFQELPPSRDGIPGGAPGEVLPQGEWRRTPTPSIYRSRRKIGTIIIAIGLVIVLAIGVFIFVRTRQRPLNTVQTFWFWADHADVNQMCKCWTEEYHRQHPEIQKELDSLFTPPGGTYIGNRVRTQCYDSLIFEIKESKGKVLAYTYAPGELTHKGSGKDKLSRMVMVKQGGNWYITEYEIY